MTLKNINVAVCDDETEVLDTIKNYLISYQIQYDIECETHTFSNGSDFLESLDKIKFNIVFLDIEMPEMDGLEILLALGQDRSIPISLSEFTQDLSDAMDRVNEDAKILPFHPRNSGNRLN